VKKYLHALILGSLMLSASAGAEDQSITIQNYTFAPNKLTVVAGTKVTWVNHDQVPHTVVEKDKQFRSSALDTNDRYSFTFNTPGVYQYFCTLHPTMTGAITVTPGK
jgi:plastocyanin